MAAEIRRYRNSRDQYYRLVYGQADSPDDAARSVPAIIGKALAHLNEDLEKELDDIKKSRIRAGQTHSCLFRVRHPHGRKAPEGGHQRCGKKSVLSWLLSCRATAHGRGRLITT